MVKYLSDLHAKKLFNLEDITSLTDNTNIGKDLLLNYKKQNLIVQIRRNLYSVTDLATKATMTNKYEIGSHISDSAYISYHSALEYHVIAHQLFFTLYYCCPIKLLIKHKLGLIPFCGVSPFLLFSLLPHKIK